MSKKAAAYQLDEPTGVEIRHPLTGEELYVTFPAGSVVPKSEEETLAIEHCVNLGIATAPDGRRATYPEPAPEDVEEASPEPTTTDDAPAETLAEDS